MIKRLVASLALVLGLILAPTLAMAQSQSGNGGGSVSDTYSADEILSTGKQFFGSITEGLAAVVEKAVSKYGLPNAYILGQEGSGAIFGGVRYGDGTMYTRNAGNRAVYWQGPTVGFDLGADASKVMMLVYNLPSVDAIYGRYPGVDGSAYMVGGLGMTAMKYRNIYIVPIRSGVGARLGVNMGYLKFTNKPTWNPF